MPTSLKRANARPSGNSAGPRRKLKPKPHPALGSKQKRKGRPIRTKLVWRAKGHQWIANLRWYAEDVDEIVKATGPEPELWGDAQYMSEELLIHYDDQTFYSTRVTDELGGKKLKWKEFTKPERHKRALRKFFWKPMARKLAKFLEGRRRSEVIGGQRAALVKEVSQNATTTGRAARGLVVRGEHEYPLIDGKPATRKFTSREYDAVRKVLALHAEGISHPVTSDINDELYRDRTRTLNRLAVDPFFKSFIFTPGGEKGAGFRVAAQLLI